MNNWTKDELESIAVRLDKQDDLIAAAAIRDYAAHLAAQAEWPSEEDVRVALNAFHDGDFPHWESTEYSREGNMRDMRAALQSVRQPVGVVSDEDVNIARKAVFKLGGEAAWIIETPHIRAALESYASRHAPTED